MCYFSVRSFVAMEEDMRRRVSMYQKTAWQSLKSVASGVFNPLVKEVERLVFPGETGVCYSINKSKNTC